MWLILAFLKYRFILLSEYKQNKYEFKIFTIFGMIIVFIKVSIV